MSDSADSPPRELHLGDYRVGRKLSEGTRTRTYEAEQISVRRPVLLERIKPDAAGDPEPLLSPAPITIIDGRAVLPFRLPRQGVSLITLTWPEEGDPS